MNILLLTGASGTGKTAIATKLAQDHRFNLVKSYTDRKKRKVVKNEDHIFILPSMMRFLLTYNIVAQTVIDGHHYCATFRQFDENKINVYVVDKNGLEQVKESLPNANVFSVLIQRQNIDIDQNRKKRNIIIPTAEDVDYVLDNNNDLQHIVKKLKTKLPFEV